MGLNRSVLSRVLNCFIDILNQKPHLPRYVLVIIDKDWFETSGMVEYGAGDACNTAIWWWIREFYKSVEVRKDHLYNKKPGALAIGSEPRFIWVAMIKRPIVRHEKLSSIYALTRKFNDKLELAVKENCHCHLLYVEMQSDPADFDTWGRLTTGGKITYWRSIDESIRKFDRNLTDLWPKLTMQHNADKKRSHDGNW